MTRHYMIAMALAMGLLAASTSSRMAHAQTQPAAQDRYYAHIAGAHVNFYRADHEYDGTSTYDYNVTSPAWGTTVGFYLVEPGYSSPAAARFGNDRMFRAAKDSLRGATSAHRQGVWLVQVKQGSTCTVVAGTLWRRTTFLVYATGQACSSSARVLRAEFDGVSRLLGRHSPAGIPWPARR